VKAEFVTPSTIVEICRDKPGMFKLASKMIFYSHLLMRDIIVPKGYETDFASIPQFLKDRIDVNGKHREAAIVHDYLCTNGADIGVTQKQADLVFNEAMTVLEVNRIIRWLMFNAVRGFQRFQCWREGKNYG